MVKANRIKRLDEDQSESTRSLARASSSLFPLI